MHIIVDYRLCKNKNRNLTLNNQYKFELERYNEDTKKTIYSAKLQLFNEYIWGKLY